jgi:hypothetical protein
MFERLKQTLRECDDFLKKTALRPKPFNSTAYLEEQIKVLEERGGRDNEEQIKTLEEILER